jgi:transmembrane sensor
LYYRYLDEWESKSPQFYPDLDEAIQSYRLRLEGSVTDKVHGELELAKPSVLGFRRYIRGIVAASILITVCFLLKKEIMFKSLQSARGKNESYLLADGTKVVLNANSKLLVPRFGFGNASREVELEGEADFDVKYAENKRFIVKMGDAYKIEVLGTQFVAYSRNTKKQVLLYQGKVKLQMPTGKQVYMKPGNLFTSTSTDSFNVTVPPNPERYMAWKEQLFYFDDTPIQDVVAQMEERFDIKIRIMDTVLLSRRIGGIYHAENADQLLEILSELLNLEVVQNQEITELYTQIK